MTFLCCTAHGLAARHRITVDDTREFHSDYLPEFHPILFDFIVRYELIQKYFFSGFHIGFCRYVDAKAAPEFGVGGAAGGYIARCIGRAQWQFQFQIIIEIIAQQK